MSCIKMIASRQLAARPGSVWGELDREGAIVITRDGRPRGIMVPTDDATLLEDVQDLVFLRARRAVRAIRAEAARNGTAALTMEDLCEEIRKSRYERRRRGPRA
jgi:tRNA(Met) C34 N-acetyltransferase TmcA